MSELAAIITVGVLLVVVAGLLTYRRARLHARARAQLDRIVEVDHESLRRVADDAHHNRHPELGRVTGRHDGAEIRRTVDEARSTLAETG